VRAFQVAAATPVNARGGDLRRTGGVWARVRRIVNGGRMAQEDPDFEAVIVPDELRCESLVRQIKLNGRSYPLFDLALFILKKPELFQVRFSGVRREGVEPKPLFQCVADGTVWTARNEAIRHVFDKHFASYYQTDKTPAERPKGVYSFVAQCGLSGTILGPPNHHDYQRNLRQLHAGKFSRMPFDAFKAKIRIVKDEAVLKQWIEDQSFKTEYVSLKAAVPAKLSSREEVERHFIENHIGDAIKTDAALTVPGTECGSMPSQVLRAVFRAAMEQQQKFPLRTVTNLSHFFSSQGLHFFKVNKTVTHVAAARPNHLDLATTPVSDGVRRILEFINSTTRCTRRKILETLAPAAVATAPENQSPPATADSTVASPVVAPAAPVESQTPEQVSVTADLRWLIHQGHVIEFANGMIETARPPKPRPVTPPRKPAPAATVQPGSPDVAPSPDTAPPPAQPAPDVQETPNSQ
jgi:hypothetical protein